MRRAIRSDSGGGTRRERMRAPRVGPGDTHILRPREVLDCIDAGSSADPTPAEGRRAAQEREARSETHVDAYAVIAKVRGVQAALDKGARARFSSGRSSPLACPTPPSNALPASVASCRLLVGLRGFACHSALPHRTRRTEASGSLYTTIRRFQGLPTCGHPSHRAHPAGTEPIQVAAAQDSS